MTKLIVARHAETIANVKGIYEGQTFDLGLSDLGKKQAIELAKAISNINIDKIFVSPLKRTMETAKPIVALTNAKVEFDRNLMETNHGVWEGKTKEWVAGEYPELLRKWLETPGEADFPGGEMFFETVNRIDKLIRLTKWEGTNLLVTHDNIIRVMICLAEKRPINQLWEIRVDQASLNFFNVVGGDRNKYLEIERLNVKDHLGRLASNVAIQAL